MSMNQNKNFSLFKKACKTRNVALFNELIQNIDLTQPINEIGEYALIYAAKHHEERMHSLMLKGANINVVDVILKTPLMYLTINKNYHSSEICEYFKLVTDFNHQDSEGNTLLMHAVKNNDLRMVKLLSKEVPHLINWNIQNHQGETASMMIYKNIRANQSSMLKIMIQNKANLDLINHNQENVYLLALKTNSFHHLEQIEKASKLDFSLVDKEGKSAFHYALEAEAIELMKKTYHSNIDLGPLRDMLPHLENKDIIDFIQACLEQDNLEKLVLAKEVKKNKVKL